MESIFSEHDVRVSYHELTPHSDHLKSKRAACTKHRHIYLQLARVQPRVGKKEAELKIIGTHTSSSSEDKARQPHHQCGVLVS